MPRPSPPALFLRQACARLAGVAQASACGADDEKGEECDIKRRTAAENHDDAQEPAGDHARHVNGAQGVTQYGQYRVDHDPRPGDWWVDDFADERLLFDQLHGLMSRHLDYLESVVKQRRSGGFETAARTVHFTDLVRTGWVSASDFQVDAVPTQTGCGITRTTGSRSGRPCRTRCAGG